MKGNWEGIILEREEEEDRERVGEDSVREMRLVRLLVMAFFARTVSDEERIGSSSERQQPDQNISLPHPQNLHSSTNPSKKEHQPANHPTSKQWGLVLAGAADFARPAEQLSLSQNTALMATGLIWTRWCFVIKPRNLFLASVNFLLFCVGATQSTRVLRYQASLEHNSVEAELKKAGKEEERDLKNVVQNPESVVKSVTDPK
ncbi:hypothetical protein D0867_09871 [Hortaea werneckii]|nr:hypothetical protein D0867_09871 [Hortaea werneckii]